MAPATQPSHPTRSCVGAEQHRNRREMKVVKPPSAQAEVIGSTDINVIRAAYSLTKASSEQAAKEVLRTLPSASYPALVRHMRQRPALFLPDVLAAVAGAVDSPKKSKAELLFV
jgi:hypothetical protein